MTRGPVTQEPGIIAVRVRISGRVQGVGFRYWTFRAAERRGLSGWVRNRSDGTVEALFAGPAGVVDEMVAACAEGPELARVTGVARQPAEAPAAPGFTSRDTL